MKRLWSTFDGIPILKDAGVIGWAVAVYFISMSQEVPFYWAFLLTFGTFVVSFLAHPVVNPKKRWLKPIWLRGNEDVVTILQDWLTGRKFNVESDPQENAHFQFRATDEEGRYVFITRIKGREHSITVWTEKIFTEKELSLLQSLGEQKYDMLVSSLYDELLRQRVSINSKIQKPLERISFFLDIPCSTELSETALVNTVYEIRRVRILVHNILVDPFYNP